MREGALFGGALPPFFAVLFFVQMQIGVGVAKLLGTDSLMIFELF